MFAAAHDVWTIGQGIGGYATLLIVLGGIGAGLWRLFKGSWKQSIASEVRAITTQVTPNGGNTSHLGDVVQRIETKVDGLTDRVLTLETHAASAVRDARTEVAAQVTERGRVHDLPAAAGGTT